VEWKKVERVIRDEHEAKGFAGRFGAGLPRINDGSFLFLQHMISKMKPVEQGGSRLAIVFNGSPLFTGGAGSGESEIRRWIIENDWLEAVVALPDQLFYNTGIFTYFWVVTNRKRTERRGKIQLIDARRLWIKMRKSLGAKRKEISPEQIAAITRLYGAFEENEQVKVFPNGAFGHLRITVERPLRLRWEITEDTLTAVRSSPKLVKLGPDGLDRLVSGLAEHRGLTSTDRTQVAGKLDPILAAGRLSRAQQQSVWDVLAIHDPKAPAITNHHGEPEPDPELRDQENVPLPESLVRYEPDPTARLATTVYRNAVHDYVEAEVQPHVPDAWVDYSKTRLGYEIPLTRHFHRYLPPRAISDIDAEIKQLETEIQELLREVTE
jgi:type I restriction enzyme M protein